MNSKFSLQILLCFVVLSLLTNCAVKTAARGTQYDILGITVGMHRADAEKRLQNVAEFDRNEERRQQVWRTKDDSHFNYLAVGYDADDKIRYVTAFANPAASERIRFSEIGDLSKAKAEIVEPHHRYIWEVAAVGEKPAYQIIVNGDNAEFVTIYSLSKTMKPGEIKDEDEEEND